MPRFIYPIHIRWADIDGYQHVNNSVYLEYMSQARAAMFFLPNSEGKFGLMDFMVVAHHEIDYKRQITYKPDPIHVHTWVEQMRGASFTTGVEMYDGDVLAVQAKTVLVRVDKETLQPRRLTAFDREFLSGFLDD